ncbi:MAG: putative photosynthetic complex assembly protein PuhE, partial [Dokdonella sp.]
WWFSTGAILYLDGLPKRTYRWSMTGATVVLIGALYALSVTSDSTSLAAAYCAFTCALLVWGWLEMSFLMGFITGTRTTACPLDASGWRRAMYAFQAIVYHEAALVTGAVVIAVITWDAPNQLGLWTFLVLLFSRASTKLNLFLGVRNLSEEFLPDHLRYLQTYFKRKPMNLLFPLSVTVGTTLAALLWQSATAASTDVATAAGLSFLATLLTLAVLEHWFLIVPINFAAMWNWSLGARRSAATVASPHSHEIDTRRLGSKATAEAVTPARP